MGMDREKKARGRVVIEIETTMSKSESSVR